MVGSCLLGALWLLLGVERHQLTDLEVWEDPEQGVSDQIGDP
jgi:hypothetical protein